MKISTMVLTGVLIGTTMFSANAITEKQIRNYKSILQLQQSDEYKTYRAEQEKKINENTKEIAELRTKRDKIKKENLSKYESRIDELEKKNNELRKKINSDYKDEGKEKWESFKKEFSHDMDELGQSLKDVFRDNIKD